MSGGQGVENDAAPWRFSGLSVKQSAEIRRLMAQAWDEGMRWGQVHWATNYGINGREADNPYLVIPPASNEVGKP